MEEETFASREIVEILLDELEHSLQEANARMPQVFNSLKNLDPYLNLKTQITLHTEEGKVALEDFKEDKELYLTALERLMGAYRDLAVELQYSLNSATGKEGIASELERQGGVIIKTLSSHQEKGKIFDELTTVLEQIHHQEKATPIQQKKIEDLVFRLQIS